MIFCIYSCILIFLIHAHPYPYGQVATCPYRDLSIPRPVLTGRDLRLHRMEIVG